MKTLRYCKVNLQKVFTSPGFYLCILFTLVLCFTAEAYIDYSENKTYSILGVWLAFSGEEILAHTEMSAYMIIRKATGGWLATFIPIMAAFPFLPLLCDESASKNVRYSVHRETKASFIAGRFLTAMVSGGLAVLCGFALFAGVVSLMFPDIGAYAPEVRESAEWWIAGTYPLFLKLGYSYLVALDAMEMFLYGAFYAVPALLVSAFLKNKYFVLCMPFFLKYLVNYMYAGTEITAYESLEVIDERVLTGLKMTDPDALEGLFSYGETLWCILLLHVGLLLLVFLLYRITMNRRVDFGE